MQTKKLSLIFLLTLAINIGAPCTAFFGQSSATQKSAKMDEATKDSFKAMGAFIVSLLLVLPLDAYFEYEDDKAISKIKSNDSEYQNATSWEKKAKISRAIEREYYTTFTFKKKWGRKGIMAGTVLGGFCVGFFYIYRSISSDF